MQPAITVSITPKTKSPTGYKKKSPVPIVATTPRMPKSEKSPAEKSPAEKSTGEKSPKKKNRRYKKKKSSDNLAVAVDLPVPAVPAVPEDEIEDIYFSNSTVLKYYTLEQNRLYDTIKDQNNLSYINYATIDCRVKKLYKLVNAAEYDQFHATLMATIHEFKNAKHIEGDPKFIAGIIDQLSRALVDVSFQKYSVAHQRIRDIHYSIINVLMDLKFIV